MKRKTAKKTYETSLFLDKEVFSSDLNSLLRLVSEKVIRTQKTFKIFTPNPEQLVLAQENKKFSKYLNQADLLIPDGIGLVIFSKLSGKIKKKSSIKERISGVDMVQELLKMSSKKSWKVLLIGGKDYDKKLHNIYIPGISKKSRLSLLWSSGYKNVSKPTREEEKNLEALIKKEKPQLVFVAFGAPHQEKWVIENENLLNKNKVKLVMVVGGSFDMLLGKLKRAPMWMRAFGLEWLFRLIQEPSRFKRQFKLVKFIRLSIIEILKF